MSYQELVRKRLALGVAVSLALLISLFASALLGPYHISLEDVLSRNVVFWNIRLPRIVTAVIVGASLAVSGAVMQCILRNPLASSFTLGISHGAAFGASFAILYLGAGLTHRAGEGVTFLNPYLVTLFAFLGSLIGVVVILALARLRSMSPEAMVLAGVAMASLFSASTMLLQYFAENEILVAYAVFWTFGDMGRTGWNEIWLMTISFLAIFPYFYLRRWDYNALLLGDETARSLGTNPERVRLTGMLAAAFLTAVSTAFAGIVGFVGLVSPHIIRMLIGSDYRFLIPLSAIFGSLLLLTADTFGRIVLSPVILPVGIVTSFIGAPLFIYILVRGGGR
ncbi:ABC-type Fe3+-siderophore transport system, permease component [Geoglobus ahangari]|uniref:ABC-type Fe3+-siderophore transport system, permease component n=1 Tax=Geoglobus ahangari TaxID=113653 RepID=A0A0F7IH04_9EURY|nr:iron ABC transporter permease [Geoglobus ahangari]AKG91974.1 ABC-type Fe3+-siderophore transport system, permease component [Geoglobus ahangari]